MDLRDQFAIAAMQGLIAGNYAYGGLGSLAQDAYAHADAMIAEREKHYVESVDEIKQMLVEAIREEHPSINTGVFLPAGNLIFQLATGRQF